MDYSRRRRARSFTLHAPNIFTVSKLTKYAFFLVVAVVIIGVIGVLLISRDLPTPGKLSSNNLSQSTKIYDRNGEVLYDIYQEQNRTYVTLDKIPKTLQEATIAIEDKDFYQNQGFSIAGYLRSALNFVIHRGISGGGSTLTQQLVKNTLLTSEQSLTRKLREFILAIQVDKKYTKNQILELYFNVAPYGGTAVGVEAASEYFFGKKAQDLNLVESAILAGLPQLPSYYNPYGENPKAYIGRTKDVLRRMREDSYITDSQEENAVKALEKVKFKKQTHAIKAPHFSFYVKNLLDKQFGENYVSQGGLRVITTLDYKLQEKAEEIVKEEVDNAASLKVGNGASIVLDPKSGEILTMVGSKDFFATETGSKDKKEDFDGQFNVITQGLRQPGSSIKPIVYAAALEKGYPSSKMIMDVATVFANPGGKDYEPKNYNGKFNGPLQLRFALGSSINIPAVKLLAMVGLKDVMDLAYRLGISTFKPTQENMSNYGLSLSLGGGDVKPLELASAYTAFANEGYKTEPVAILKVTDPKGKVLYEKKDVSKEKVLSAEAAFIISHMLYDNNARLLTFGPNSYLNIPGKTVAVKTGTTDDKRDNWTVGWTPNVLVVTWVGNNDNSQMGNVASGVTGAAPIWRRIILEALKGRPNTEFKKPENVVALEIDALGGGLPVDGQAKRTEYFIKGTEPQGPADIYKELKVSKSDNNKLASQSEIDAGQYDTKKFIVFHENDPVSSDGKNRWQEGIDAWLQEAHKDDPLYKAPTEQSDKKVEGASTSSNNSNPTATPEPTQTPTPTP